MKRHLLALGILVALTFFSIFYVSFNIYVIPMQKVSLALRLLLPLITGGYALAIGRSAAWLPSSDKMRRMLLMTLFPLVAFTLAIVARLSAGEISLLFSSVALNILTSVATVLFWQGLIWQQMKKSQNLFLKAVRISLLQMAFGIGFMFVALVPIVGLQSLWTMLSFVKTLKAFQVFSIAAISLAAFSFILLLAGFINLALAQMMEWTGSILYPALAYGVTTSLMTLSGHWSVKLAEYGMGFLSAFVALAAIGSFIYLYRGCRKLSERATLD